MMQGASHEGQSPPNPHRIMSKSLHLVAATLLAAPLAAQNTQFSFDLDQPNNIISWDVSASIGSVNVSPSTFKIGGTVELLLDASSAPFSSGAINGALSFTDPASLHGEIPNIFPWLPPLATFDINNLEFHLFAPSFSIDPAGNFTASVTLTTTAGTNVLGGLFGSGSEPVYGVVSAPTVVSGTLTQSGSTLTLFIDMDVTVTITDPGTGVSSDITFDGPLTGFADTADADSFHLFGPLPMGTGSNSLGFTGATPSSTVFLAGSAAGRGSVFIAPLGVTLGIANPLQVGAATSDASGDGSINVSVPGAALGLSLWVQAVESGAASNVFGTWVE